MNEATGRAGRTSDAEPGGPAAAAVEPRQRWRVAFARSPIPSERVGRASLDAWAAALAASGLPVATTEAGETGRLRFTIGAPLGAVLEGRNELLDVWLTSRLPLWRVRTALEPVMPADHRFVSAEDVWLGAPPLPGRVAAADYLVAIEDLGPDAALAPICRAILDAASLERVRQKAGADRRYDLRPLVLDVADAGVVGGLRSVRMRTRIHPELGAGRPEEVIAEIADRLGRRLPIAKIVRERLVLADDLPNGRLPQTASATATNAGRN